MEGKIATPQSVEIAKRLRSLRESVGLNPEQLSRAIYEKSGVKIGRNSIINYEVGESYNTKTDKNLGMRAEYVIALADFYGVSTDYLLGRTPNKTTNPKLQEVSEYTGLSAAVAERLHNSVNPERAQVLELLISNPWVLNTLHAYLYMNVDKTGQWKSKYTEIEKGKYDRLIPLVDSQAEKWVPIRTSTLGDAVLFAAVEGDLRKLKEGLQNGQHQERI